MTTEQTTALRLVVATDRLRDFLSKAFLSLGQDHLETVNVEVTPKHFITKGWYYGDVVANYLVASQRFFKEYNVVKDTNLTIPIRSTLLDNVSKRFKSDESVAIEITDKVIRIIGKNETFEDDLPALKTIDFPVEIKPLGIDKDTTVFVPPKSDETKNVIVDHAVSQLQDLPSVKTFGFEDDGTNFLFKVDSNLDNSFSGRYSKIIEGTAKKHSPLSIQVDAAFFSRLIKNLNGNAWLFAGEDDIILTQTTPELVTTFLLVTNIKQ